MPTKNGAIETPATCGFELITPDIAVQWLAKPVRNRRINSATVRKYTRLMEDDVWLNFHPQPIIIDHDGRVANGRHRLSALKEAGKSYYMLIVRYKPGLFPDTLLTTLDRGAQRTIEEILGIGTGQEAPRGGGAITRYMYFGMRPSTSAVPDDVLVRFFTTHSDKILHVLDVFSKRVKGITRAPVLAVCARALYHVAVGDIQRFAQILTTGISSSPKDHVAINLRNWLLQHAPKGGGGSGANEIYQRTSYALYAFCQKREVKRLIRADAELFPLPGETAQEVLVPMSDDEAAEEEE